jgi:hypothetical protein
MRLPVKEPFHRLLGNDPFLQEKTRNCLGSWNPFIKSKWVPAENPRNDVFRRSGGSNCEISSNDGNSYLLVNLAASVEMKTEKLYFIY